jgi:hypothetical protein
MMLPTTPGFRLAHASAQVAGTSLLADGGWTAD